MKKNLLISSAILGLTLVSSAATVFADDGGTYPTTGSVSFVAGDDVTPPTDPTEPGNPVQPIDPPTPVGGALSIDYASNFKFGEQKISTDDEQYFAALDQFKNPDGGDNIENVNYVQVTDKRGSLVGWNLSAEQVGQFETAEHEVLTGAQLKINTASAVAGVADGSLDTYTPSTVANKITFTPGVSQPGITAEAGKGAGTWVYRFGDTKKDGATAVELDVPGKTVKLAKQYTTTINWTLATTPDNV